MELDPQLREIIAEVLQVEPDEVLIYSEFTTDLGADDLAMVELALTIEDKFGVVISDDDIENMRKVSDVQEYLSKAGH